MFWVNCISKKGMIYTSNVRACRANVGWHACMCIKSQFRQVKKDRSSQLAMQDVVLFFSKERSYLEIYVVQFLLKIQVKIDRGSI
jgi:hypothetical protein